MMLSYRVLLLDRQALSEHTTTSSFTQSVGQALRGSLIKPGAYLKDLVRGLCPPERRCLPLGHERPCCLAPARPLLRVLHGCLVQHGSLVAAVPGDDGGHGIAGGVRAPALRF